MSQDDGEEIESAASKADVVWHPTRLQIMNALSPDRRLTVPQINARLPDVAQATLYRHLKILVDAEVVQVLEETNARGATEKVYALPEQEVVLDLANSRPEDLVRYFSTFVSVVLNHGRAFFGQPDYAKRRGGNYSTDALYLTDKEYEHFCTALQGLTSLARTNQPGPGRRRRMFYTATLPDDTE